MTPKSVSSPYPQKKRHQRRCHNLPEKRNDTQKGAFDLLIEKRHQQKLFHGAQMSLFIPKKRDKERFLNVSCSDAHEL